MYHSDECCNKAKAEESKKEGNEKINMASAFNTVDK